MATTTLALAHAWGIDARNAGLDRDTLDTDREAVRAIRDAAWDDQHGDAYTEDEAAIKGAWLMGYAGAGLTQTMRVSIRDSKGHLANNLTIDEALAYLADTKRTNLAIVLPSGGLLNAGTPFTLWVQSTRAAEARIAARKAQA